MKREWIKLLAISVLLMGCGEGENETSLSSTVDSGITSVRSSVPAYKAINNRGTAVEGKMAPYTVKLFANAEEALRPQERHQGVVVKYEGKTSETMAIQASYHGKEIVVGIYNGDKLIKLSEPILVTDDPVVIINM